MEDEILALTAEIASAYLNGAAASGAVKPDDLPRIIREVYATLSQPMVKEPEAVEPVAMPSKREITKSITPDALISFVDGKPYKTLKRHLSTNGLTIEEYKARFGLPSDYPTVAPNYSAARSAMAKSLGLGSRTGRSAKAAPAPATSGSGRHKKNPA